MPSTGVFLGLGLKQVEGEVGAKKLMEAQGVGALFSKQARASGDV